MSGAYSGGPEEEFGDGKPQKHTSLLVRGAAVAMDGMGCCESVV